VRTANRLIVIAKSKGQTLDESTAYDQAAAMPQSERKKVWIEYRGVIGSPGNDNEDPTTPIPPADHPGPGHTAERILAIKRSKLSGRVTLSDEAEKDAYMQAKNMTREQRKDLVEKYKQWQSAGSPPSNLEIGADGSIAIKVTPKPGSNPENDENNLAITTAGAEAEKAKKDAVKAAYGAGKLSEDQVASLKSAVRAKKNPAGKAQINDTDKVKADFMAIEKIDRSKGRSKPIGGFTGQTGDIFGGGTPNNALIGGAPPPPPSNPNNGMGIPG
jgi:hypothetical protein